mmetsp:Transcript_10337/g.19847  ORF Transcript_10337/g.19847 Transcript_10337/m.19847 type:complete len:88 (+) Transcript_10337:323-586(+)
MNQTDSFTSDSQTKEEIIVVDGGGGATIATGWWWFARRSVECPRRPNKETWGTELPRRGAAILDTSKRRERKDMFTGEIKLTMETKK